MPKLRHHMWRTITIFLVVNDFGIKVTDIADFYHLKTALKEDYKVAIEWLGLLFCGVKLM
jgi:hypothetical protein